MTHRALIIDDDRKIVEAVADIVESLRDEYEAAASQEEARRLIAENRYSYILLDLEIPVRVGRGLPRIRNGQNLLAEIVDRFGKQVPVIIMTGYGTDSPDLAVECIKDGAIDYVTKPFRSTGKTLDRAILDALKRTGQSRPKHLSRPRGEPRTFEGGRMTLYSNRIELCEVDIPISKLVRRILVQLMDRRPNGKYVAYSGSELAERIECDRGQNGVAEAIHRFRDRVREVLLTEANITCGRSDVVQSGGPGYRLKEWVTVVKAGARRATSLATVGVPVNDPDVPVNVPVNGSDDPVNQRDDPVNVPDASDGLNERQRWALSQLEQGIRLRMGMVVEHFDCSSKTAKRDLAMLKRLGRIEFTGSPKGGYYQLKDQRLTPTFAQAGLASGDGHRGSARKRPCRP